LTNQNVLQPPVRRSGDLRDDREHSSFHNTPNRSHFHFVLRTLLKLCAIKITYGIDCVHDDLSITSRTQCSICNAAFFDEKSRKILVQTNITNTSCPFWFSYDVFCVKQFFFPRIETKNKGRKKKNERWDQNRRLYRFSSSLKWITNSQMNWNLNDGADIFFFLHKSNINR